MCRKTTKAAASVFAVAALLVIIVRLMYPPDADIYSTRSVLSDDGRHEEHVIFVANQIFIMDKESYAHELVERFRENRFPSFLFSFDAEENEGGKPTALIGKVYRYRRDVTMGKPDFTFRCIVPNATGIYNPNDNLIDNPEKYIVEVDYMP